MKTADRVFARQGGKRGVIVGSAPEIKIIRVDTDRPVWVKAGTRPSGEHVVLTERPHWRVLWDRTDHAVRVAEDMIETQQMRDEAALIQENERLALVEEAMRRAPQMVEHPDIQRYSLVRP